MSDSRRLLLLDGGTQLRVAQRDGFWLHLLTFSPLHWLFYDYQLGRNRRWFSVTDSTCIAVGFSFCRKLLQPQGAAREGGDVLLEGPPP